MKPHISVEINQDASGQESNLNTPIRLPGGDKLKINDKVSEIILLQQDTQVAK